jgi:hypothetical protein
VSLAEGVSLTAWEPNVISTLDPEAYYERGEAVWLTWETQNALVLSR